jgi:hypothetical protein
MNTTWVPVNGDDLQLMDKAVAFLQGEFCPADADPVWSVEYFRWKLGSDNPAGAGYVSLAMLDDKVVGIVSLTKKRLLVNGKPVAGGEVGDTYTSARVRRGAQPAVSSTLDPDPASFVNRSIFGRLASDTRARADADGIRVIYGTPNANAYPGWTKRLGYFDFQAYDNQSFSRPTWRMFIKRYPGLAFAKSVIQAGENGLISVHAALSRAANGGLVFGVQPPSEEEIEALWERVKPSKGFSLVRDGEYWRHRYLEHPLARYVLFDVRRQEVLVGVVAIRLTGNGGGKSVLSIVEWMTEEYVSFGFLLTQTLDAFKSSEIDSFNFWANAAGQEAKAARQSLFVRRGRVPIIFADTVGSREVGAMKNSIYFYLGSADAA